MAQTCASTVPARPSINVGFTGGPTCPNSGSPRPHNPRHTARSVRSVHSEFFVWQCSLVSPLFWFMWDQFEFKDLVSLTKDGW